MAQRYIDCHHAITAANALEWTCIAWRAVDQVWVIYDPRDGARPGDTPELFCIRDGMLPIALSEEGATIIAQLTETA
jgi:hypothetical protein